MSSNGKGSVHLTTLTPGGKVIVADIGTFTVPDQDGEVEPTDVYRALGELLCEAGGYLLAGGTPEELPA
ncbi:hypothetical protein ACFQ7W_00740 [Streptomyces niveus]|uniref:hypothetical protein n=1 Tax=Streptomyces niveus TaxID=193462 RepID=UPI0036B8114E